MTFTRSYTKNEHALKTQVELSSVSVHMRQNSFGKEKIIGD